MHVRLSKVTRNGKTYTYGQLVESYRRKKDGMPAHRVVASLGSLDEHTIANLRAAFEASRKGQSVVVDPPTVTKLALNPVQANLRYLDVAVCWRLWKRWKLGELLGGLLERPGHEVPAADVVAALVVQRCVAPASKLAAQRWLPTTALPELFALPPQRFNNTRVHRVLAELEQVDGALQEQLAKRTGAIDGGYRALFMDVTDTWFVGHGPESAQTGKTKEGMIRRKVGIVLLCDQRGFPVRWTVIPGKKPDGEAMLAMVTEIANLSWTANTPLVCDRSMGKACYVEALLRSDLRFLTAIPVSEFTTYSNDIPIEALSSVEVQDRDDTVADTMKAAAAAVRDAGMTEVSEQLLVRDLGALHPFGDFLSDGVDDKPPTDIEAAAMSAAAELRIGLKMKEDLAEGRTTGFGAMGLRYGCNKKHAAELVWITELNDEVQRAILDGEAEEVSRRALLRIRCLPSEQQNTALRAAIAEAARPGTQWKRRKAAGGKKSKKAKVKGAVGAPVRAVLYFNPEVFVQKRRTALRHRAQVDAAVAALNKRLASPQSNRTEQSILGEIGRLLRPLDLLSAYEPIVSTCEIHGRKRFRVELHLDEDNWNQRRRFDGFSLLVGHADLDQRPEDLVQLYRDKDAIEKDFRTIKSEFRIRPVWHRTDPKLRAHVTVCILALLIERTLEQRLREAGIAMTAERALEELAPCHLNQLAIEGASEPVYSLTRPTDDQKHLLSALRMTELTDDDELSAAISHVRQA